MIIRKIKPEEITRTEQIFALAFEIPLDIETPVENDTEIENSNDLSERWAAFKEDNTTMMGFFIATAYSIRFDDNICKMTGIGAVSTLPEFRRRGVIRECFNSSLKHMYENGFSFSYLFPFSTNYYRQFGYELCCEKFKHTIHLSSISPFNIDGNCYLVENGEMAIDDIKLIHRQFTEKYNLAVVRNDCDFSWVKKLNPSVDQIYTYIYKNKAGIPKGFFSFTKQRQDITYHMNCSNFMFSDIEGLKGLLNFAHTFATNYENIVFTLPSDINIAHHLCETTLFPYKCEKILCGMVRVINVEQVLKMAQYKGSGSVIVQVTDKQIPQNTNTFKVIFNLDKATDVSVSTNNPDISLDITDFSRLIVGSMDYEDFKHLDNVDINSNEIDIAKVFYKKPNTVMDYF